MLQVFSAFNNSFDNGQGRWRVLVDCRFNQFEINIFFNGSQSHSNIFESHFFTGKGDHLIQSSLTVAHGTAGGPGDLVKAFVLNLNFFSVRNAAQLFDQGIHTHGPEFKALAAGLNGTGELMNFGGS